MSYYCIIYNIFLLVVDNYESGTWLFLKSIAEEMSDLPRISRLELQAQILQLVMEKVKEHHLKKDVSD